MIKIDRRRMIEDVVLRTGLITSDMNLIFKSIHVVKLLFTVENGKRLITFGSTPLRFHRKPVLRNPFIKLFVLLLKLINHLDIFLI